MYDRGGNYQWLDPVDSENFESDLVNPRETAQEFHVTTVADDQGAEDIAKAVYKEQGERGSGTVAGVDYDKSLDEVLDGFESSMEQGVQGSPLLWSVSPEGVMEANDVDGATSAVDEVAIESDGEMAEEANGVRFSVVRDPIELARLISGPTVKRYRAMVEINGKLYPPMSVYDGKVLRDPTEEGVWEKSDETPIEFTEKQLARMQALDERSGSGNVTIIPGKIRYHKGSEDGKGTIQFRLKKDNGDTIWAAYNPYFHTSTSGLNDQFSSAWKRPNLVVVEVEIPESELTDGYRAAHAKNAVGDTDWHSGPVNGQLPADRQRTVTLSRYAKVVGKVSDAAVAKMVAAQLKGTGLSVPFNTVTPGLRDALVKEGVKIGRPQKGNAGAASLGAYREWQKESGVRFSVDPYAPTVENYNRQFNEDLQDFIDGKLPKNHIFDLGDTSELMQKCGLENLPIELVASKLNDKRLQSNHVYDVNKLKDLVKAINNPLAVFRSLTRHNRFVIMTDIKDRRENFILAIEKRYESSDWVYDVRSIYPKNPNGILSWLAEDWNEKEGKQFDNGNVKFLRSDFDRTWLTPTKYELRSKQPSNLAEVRSQLNHAAKLAQLFESPKYFEEKSAKTTENGGVLMSVTPAQDREFMEAAERGDMAKAEQMVKEAVKAAMPLTKVVGEDGEPLVVYHGTPHGGFTVFKPSNAGKTFSAAPSDKFSFFTSSPFVADGYRTMGMWGMTDEEREELFARDPSRRGERKERRKGYLKPSKEMRLKPKTPMRYINKFIRERSYAGIPEKYVETSWAVRNPQGMALSPSTYDSEAAALESVHFCFF